MHTDQVRYVTRHYYQLQGLTSRAARRRLPRLRDLAHRSAMAPHEGQSKNGVALLLVRSGWRCSVAADPIVVHVAVWHRGAVALEQWRHSFGGVNDGLLLAITLQEAFAWSWPAPALFVGATLFGIGVSHHGGPSTLCVRGARVLSRWRSLHALGLSIAIRDIAFDLVLGVVLLVAGVGDHRLLVSTLGGRRGEAYVGSL